MVKRINSFLQQSSVNIKRQQPYIIGITGRSGSGKTTFVRNIQSSFDSEQVSIHTMDNYYLPVQIIDDQGYKNFDLPTSFYKQEFCDDLEILKSGKDLEISKYEFKIEGGSHSIKIKSAPIILVEGLFIYHYEEIINNLDFKVMVDLSKDKAYQRRLKRDTVERNYSEEVTKYRYLNHVEPAYLQFIAPYYDRMDLIVDNNQSLKEGESFLKTKIKGILG